MSFQATYWKLLQPAVIVSTLVLVSVPMAWVSGEWAAWIVIHASFVPALLLKSAQRDLSLAFALITVVASHHLVSLANVYWTVLPGAEIDATTFHSEAIQLAIDHALYFDIGYEFYENLLGVFYSLLGPSLLLGQALSVLVFSLSCVVFICLLDVLEIRRYRWVILLVYGLLPSTLLITSFTLREAWELLFFMLTVL